MTKSIQIALTFSFLFCTYFSNATPFSDSTASTINTPVEAPIQKESATEAIKILHLENSFVIKGINKINNVQLIDLAGRQVQFEAKLTTKGWLITPEHFNSVKENFIVLLNNSKGDTLIKRVDLL